MTPSEFAEVQRQIKAGLALNADLQHQQVIVLKNIQVLLRSCLIVGGLVLCICLTVIAFALPK